MKEFLSKMESFVRRLRWKAFFFDNKTEVEQNNHDNYRFKSDRCPPQHKSLKPFENDLYELAKNIKLRKISYDFQQQLAEDVNKIKTSDELYIHADKTSNIYLQSESGGLQETDR